MNKSEAEETRQLQKRLEFLDYAEKEAAFQLKSRLFFLGYGKSDDLEELRKEQAEVENIYKMSIKEIEKTCDKFMEMLARAELEHANKTVSSNGITKEQIEKFFDEAVSNIFANEIEGYEETEDAQFTDYDWDAILSRPDAAKFIDSLALHYYADFAAPTLAADDKGLHIVNWGGDEELLHACAGDHLREDLEDYSLNDVIQSVQTGKFTKAVTGRYDFLADDTRKKEKGLEKE
jgi:hypothetical protein